MRTKETEYYSCEECMFWDKSGSDKGRCRRNPPVRISGVMFGWVTTDRLDWCGRFSKWDGSK